MMKKQHLAAVAAISLILVGCSVDDSKNGSSPTSSGSPSASTSPSSVESPSPSETPTKPAFQYPTDVSLESFLPTSEFVQESDDPAALERRTVEIDPTRFSLEYSNADCFTPTSASLAAMQVEYNVAIYSLAFEQIETFSDEAAASAEFARRVAEFENCVPLAANPVNAPGATTVLGPVDLAVEQIKAGDESVLFIVDYSRNFTDLPPGDTIGSVMALVRRGNALMFIEQHLGESSVDTSRGIIMRHVEAAVPLLCRYSPDGCSAG